MKTDGLPFVVLKDSVSPLEIGECWEEYLDMDKNDTTIFHYRSTPTSS